VLGEHPYPHRLCCIKIRANSFCSTLKQFLIFVSLTPHIIWNRKFADHLKITIWMWEKYFGFLCHYLYIYFKNLFWNLNNLKFKFSQKNLDLFFLHSICYFLNDLQKNQIEMLHNWEDKKKDKMKKVKVCRAHLLHWSFPLISFSVTWCHHQISFYDIIWLRMTSINHDANQMV
jgi:hypothetical protein